MPILPLKVHKAIGMLVGVLVGLAIFLVPAIFYLLTLQKALNRCSPESRAMQPGMVWLLLIPLFNLVWQFFVVINIAKSLVPSFRNEAFRKSQILARRSVWSWPSWPVAASFQSSE